MLQHRWPEFSSISAVLERDSQNRDRLRSQRPTYLSSVSKSSVLAARSPAATASQTLRSSNGRPLTEDHIKRKTTDGARDGCCCRELGGTGAQNEREEHAPRGRGASMHATRVRCGTGSLGFGCRGGSGAVARAHGPCFRDPPARPVLCSWVPCAWYSCRYGGTSAVEYGVWSRSRL